MSLVIKGLLLIAIGIALIFPFLSDYMWRVVIVIAGVSLVFHGFKLIFAKDTKNKKCLMPEKHDSK